MTAADFKRRLSAILSADVQGYSRLMRDDEEATVRTLTSYRTAMTHLIHQYRGRVVDSPGDNILAEFTSVVDAVNCGVEIQRELAERNAGLVENRKMRFRIGINLGDILEEGQRIYGDGVNIAARMEGLATAGEICISGTVYDAIQNKIGLEYDYLGEHEVKNIDQPVRAYRVLSHPGNAAHRVVQAKKAAGRTWRNLALVATALILVAGAAAIWQFYYKSTPPTVEPASVEKMAYPLPDRPSIAVLPFTNLSGDPEQEYFSDGMTDDLITDLSKISGLFVIARNSVFTYKGKPVNVEQVSRELGVRYVLEGSVRRAENQVRINAQLIDAETGGHLWAERYDGAMTNIFALQDKITQKIVSALAVKLTPSEQEQVTIKETESDEAYDEFLKGQGCFLRWTREDTLKAITHLKKAVELDPSYGRAYGLLGWIYWNAHWSWTDTMSYKTNRLLAGKYLELAMKDGGPYAHRVSAEITVWLRKYDEAISEAERALSLAPNDPAMHGLMAYILNWAGRPEEAIEHARLEMRYDPRRVHLSLHRLGIASFSMGNYAQAAACFERSLAHRQEFKWPYFYLAACYAHLGREKEAQDARSNFMIEYPELLLIKRLIQFLPFKNIEVIDRLADGLLKAGFVGEPSGYYKLLEANRLSGEEIKELVLGRKITGFDIWEGSYWTETYGANGEFYRYGGGTAWIDNDNDLLCFKLKYDSEGLKDCCAVFRNPDGTREEKTEYLSLHYYGIRPWSLVN